MILSPPSCLFLSLIIAAALIAGCSSTSAFVTGHTGPRAAALPDDAPVAVLGADADDPQQMKAFTAALEKARRSATPLGTSSFVRSATYRDAAAANAARQLGANRVLYTFAYQNATTEHSPQPGYAFPVNTHGHYGTAHSDRNLTVITAPTTTRTTRHWWHYRAYFFAE